MSSKVYRSMRDLSTRVDQGELATVADGTGYSMYVFIGDRWRKYATAFDIGDKNEKVIPRLSTGPKGVFSTVSVNRRPKSNEIGSISGNISSNKGIFGDTCITMRTYSKTSSVGPNHVLLGNDGYAIDTGTTKSTVGNTNVMAFSSSLGDHFRYIQYIAPYDMKVVGISAIWSDELGTSSGTSYLGIWTSPSGVTDSEAVCGTAGNTYTLKWIASKGATIAAGQSVQVSDNNLGTDAFDLNAGDWVILTQRNTNYSSSTLYVAAHVTLYCKFR